MWEYLKKQIYLVCKAPFCFRLQTRFIVFYTHKLLSAKVCVAQIISVMGCKPVSLLVSLSASIFFGYFGFRIVHRYFRTRSWQLTNSKLNLIQTVSGKKTFYEVISLDWSNKKCSISYNYTVSGVVYNGTYATLDSRLGDVSLCDDLRRGIRESTCYYNPNNPAKSALRNTLPITAMGVCIVISFLNLAVLISSVSAYLVLIPTLYGVISGAILLTIAIQRWPTKDAALVTGVILIIIPILGPCSRRCNSKQGPPNDL